MNHTASYRLRYYIEYRICTHNYIYNNTLCESMKGLYTVWVVSLYNKLHLIEQST